MTSLHRKRDAVTFITPPQKATIEWAPMECPVCGFPKVYDNTASKKNAKSPDRRCARPCGWVEWNTPFMKD
jgi:hypothetical protein